MADGSRKSILQRLNPLGRPQKESAKIEEVIIPDVPGSEVPISGMILSDKTLASHQEQLDLIEKKKVIDLYRSMESDAIISAALDLYADNATQTNERTGHVVSVQMADKRIEGEINDFLWNIMKVDTECWEWVRAVARDGEIYIDTQADPTKWAFVMVDEPSNINALIKGQNEIAHFVVSPLEEKKDGYESRLFSVAYGKAENKSSEYIVEDADRYIVGFNSRVNGGTMTLETNTLYGEPIAEDFKIQAGKSALANVVTTFQSLSALEDAIFINRLTKSTAFKIVHVDVSDSNNTQAKQIVEAVKNAFKSSETIDMNTGTYQSRQSPIPINDFIYVPTKGTKGAITMQEVGGEVGEVNMNDVDYYRNKLFAGLGVLKAYLGFEETTPGGLGDSTLTMLDERLGRRVKRLQTVLKGIIDQSILYYWKYSTNDRTESNLPEYMLILGKVSTKEDEERQKRFTEAVSNANALISLAKDELFVDKINPDKFFDYIFEDLLGVDTNKFNNEAQLDEMEISIREIPENQKTISERRAKRSSAKRNKVEAAIKRLLVSEGYTVYIETSNGTQIPLSRALDMKRYNSKLLQEKTYKQLKDDSKTKDPARLKKSKKIIVKYIEVNGENFLEFRVTAEDPAKNAKEGKPTSYTTQVSLKDFAALVKKSVSQGVDGGTPIKEKDLVMQAIQGEIAVSCSCPAAKWWGQQYLGTQHDYSIDKNDIAPTKNIPLQPICKHTLATLTALPFWWNTIIRDLRDDKLLPSNMTIDQLKTVAQKAKEEPETVEVDIDKAEENYKEANEEVEAAIPDLEDIHDDEEEILKDE